jgi:hypothetical protein
MPAFVFLRVKGAKISLGIQYSSMKNNEGINSKHRAEFNRNKIRLYFCYFSSLEKRKGTIFVKHLLNSSTYFIKFCLSMHTFKK